MGFTHFLELAGWQGKYSRDIGLWQPCIQNEQPKATYHKMMKLAEYAYIKGIFSTLLELLVGNHQPEANPINTSLADHVYFWYFYFAIKTKSRFQC